jgi:hypothetical protein
MSSDKKQKKKKQNNQVSTSRHTHVPQRPGLQTNPTHEHHPMSQSSSNASDGLGNASDGLGLTCVGINFFFL